jgi:hypothetical protein
MKELPHTTQSTDEYRHMLVSHLKMLINEEVARAASPRS